MERWLDASGYECTARLDVAAIRGVNHTVRSTRVEIRCESGWMR